MDNEIPDGRVLAIDWGTKRIGIAISDTGGTLASPYSTLTNQQGNIIKQIQKIIEREEIRELVVGLPLNMDGTAGRSVELVTKFGEELKMLGLPIHFVDGRLSSFSAERMLREIGRKPSRKKELVDRAAAAVVLQEFLDSRKS